MCMGDLKQNDLKYRDITNEDLLIYLNSLVGKIYKMLPMMEDGDITVNKYISSFVHELCGLAMIMGQCEHEKRMLLTIVCTLEPFICNQDCFSHDVYKREIFKCIDLVNKIIEKRMSIADLCEEGNDVI